MDQEALVDLTLEEGARLDSALRRRGMPTDAPVAAFDHDFGEWFLLLGMPSGVSRRRLYEEISSAIFELDLRISLDNVFLVNGSDPGLQELRSLAGLPRRSLTNDTPIVDVAGRSFALPRLVRMNYADYEKAVADAVKLILPDGNVLHDEIVSSSEFLAADDEIGRKVHRADLVVEVNGQVLLVEAKAGRRTLSMQQALSAFGLLSLFKSGARENVVMLLVSMAGFSRGVESRFRDVPEFVLVTWTIGDDHRILADALQRAGVR